MVSDLIVLFHPNHSLNLTILPIGIRMLLNFVNRFFMSFKNFSSVALDASGSPNSSTISAKCFCRSRSFGLMVPQRSKATPQILCSQVSFWKDPAYEFVNHHNGCMGPKAREAAVPAGSRIRKIHMATVA